MAGLHKVSNQIPCRQQFIRPSTTQENESEGNCSNGNKESKSVDRKLHVVLILLNDLVDIITCNKHYRGKVIFTNTKNQNNGIICGEISNKLERANEKGEQITFII